MGKVIGIDIATTYSVVAVFEGGKPVIINNQEGKASTPSVVSFDTNTGERKVGDSALRQAIINPKSTIHSVKRLIGRKYDECADDIKNLQYEVVNENGLPRIKVGDRTYTPEEITAAIIQKLKSAAEDYLGEKVTDCVISVPAMFDDSQRQNTKLAAEACGLNVLRVINEPTAACLAAHVENNGSDKRYMVIDNGGGTQDTTILEYGDGVYEILASKGDSQLGGNDFDWAIMKWIINDFKNEEGIDLSEDPMALQRIKEASERAKIELSSTVSTDINLPYITAVNGVPKHIAKKLTRAEFDKLTANLVIRHKESCDGALKAAKLCPEDIDGIILVGGTSRIPSIQKMVKDCYGDKINMSVNFDTAIAEGCAIEGAVLNKEEGVGDIVLLDITPLRLGISTMGDVMTTLIEENTTIPCKKDMEFTNAQGMQSQATIAVYSGNRPMAKDNKLLGMFNIDITPSPRNTNRIKVTFDINANGILTVSAVDEALNKEGHITIENSSSMTPEEIERMKQEAEMYAEEDKRRKDEADKINEADTFIFSIENAMGTMNVSDEDKNTVNPLISKLKEAISNRNLTEIEDAKKKLEETWGTIAQKAYQASSYTGTSGNSPDKDEKEKPNKDDFQDAEVVD